MRLFFVLILPFISLDFYKFGVKAQHDGRIPADLERTRHHNISLVLYKELKLLLSHYSCVLFTWICVRHWLYSSVTQWTFLIFCRYNFTFRYGKNPAAPSGKNAAAALCMHPVLCFPVLIYSLIYSLIIEPQNQKILWTGRNL